MESSSDKNSLLSPPTISTHNTEPKSALSARVSMAAKSDKARPSVVTFAESPPAPNFASKDKQSPSLTSSSGSWFAWMSPSWSGWDIPSTKVIRSFNIIKAAYIFMLVPYHITCVARLVPTRPTYGSFYLPYATTYHGLEYMMGLLFISGWLSHATTRVGITFSELLKKKLLRLLPAYYIGGIVFTFVCIVWEGSTGHLQGAGGSLGVGIQFALECLTLGSWNPALLWWTRNRPLWFIATLLCYYYILPWYLPWVRGLKSTWTVFAVMMTMVIVRMGLGLAVYASLTVIYPHRYEHYPRIAHLWCITQIFLPFIGCTLCEYSNRIGKLKWHRNTIWRVTDAVTVVTVAMAMFVVAPPLWTAKYDNESGLFLNESKGAYLFGSLCAFSQFMVWPLMLIGVYLYSHDISTLTWIYTCYPRLFETAVASSFALFLTHWPILLILQKTHTFDTTSGVSVLMLFCVCLSTSLVYDNFVIQPLEERIVAYFNPPAPKPASRSSTTSMVIKAEVQKKLQAHREDVKVKDEIIKALEDKLLTMEETIESLRQNLRQTIPDRRGSIIVGDYRPSQSVRPTWDLDEEDESTNLLLDVLADELGSNINQSRSRGSQVELGDNL